MNAIIDNRQKKRVPQNLPWAAALDETALIERLSRIALYRSNIRSRLCGVILSARAN
jgi:hypothetical protein